MRAKIQRLSTVFIWHLLYNADFGIYAVLPYIFFDRGFKKLALRELSLRLSRAAGGNHNKIVCAGTSDYTPYIKNYGMYFAEKARVEEEKSYLSSEEYLQREACRKKSLEWVKDQI